MKKKPKTSKVWIKLRQHALPPPQKITGGEVSFSRCKVYIYPINDTISVFLFSKPRQESVARHRGYMDLKITKIRFNQIRFNKIIFLLFLLLEPPSSNLNILWNQESVWALNRFTIPTCIQKFIKSYCMQHVFLLAGHQCE